MENYSFKAAIDEILVLNKALIKVTDENKTLKRHIKILELSLKDVAAIFVNEGISNTKWMYDWGIIGQITEH